MIGTLNNKNFNKINSINIDEVKVAGLSEKNNYDLINRLDFLKVSNILFLKKTTITDIINPHTLVEQYSVFKNYPSTIFINIEKTKFLAQLKRKDGIFLLGSNGKFTKTNELNAEIPFIFGNFENKNFFELKNTIDKTNFKFNEIKKLFSYKSGRWDIETKNGLLIKLPKERIKESLDLMIVFFAQNKKQNIRQIDLRQHNQIIING